MSQELDRRTLLAAAGATLFGPGLDQDLAQRPMAVTGGQITGAATTVPGVVAWLGIPYAAPPTGKLRWRPPQPVEPWAGVRRAGRFAASPWAMSDAIGGLGGRRLEMDEDCLTLNVWVPAAKSNKPRPVMVWIYGGAFVEGATDDPLYDGANMAAAGVVFVSINYRVGILGFFAHPELAQESPEGVSGNYGLLDQIAALRWVRDNIAQFGGDPDNVTILGQSAGSFSVAFHLVMPQSRGLFHRAIAESGAAMGRLNSLVLLTDGREMEAQGRAFAVRVGAPDLAALRAKDPMSLMKADHETWIFHPALDGVVIPDHPFRMIRDGRHADVPLIAGFNADEGAAFQPLGGGTPQGLTAALEANFGAHAAAAQRIYPAANDAEAANRGRQVFGDLIFTWNTATLATAMARYGRQPVYFYHFAYTGVPSPGHPDLKGVAFHGAEIGLVLKNPGGRGNPVAPDLQRMSELLSGYWLAFAGRGNPNGSNRPPWPVFKPGAATVLHIDGVANSAGPMPFRERLSLVGRTWGNPILDDA